jgi:Protein of unknown function (DUF541)
VARSPAETVERGDRAVRLDLIHRPQPWPDVSRDAERPGEIAQRHVDLNKVGEVLDQATLAGANSVNQVSFGLENNEASRRETLSAATADAVARVQAIARALNNNDGSPVVSELLM